MRCRTREKHNSSNETHSAGAIVVRRLVTTRTPSGTFRDRTSTNQPWCATVSPRRGGARRLLPTTAAPTTHTPSRTIQGLTPANSPWCAAGSPHRGGARRAFATDRRTNYAYPFIDYSRTDAGQFAMVCCGFTAPGREREGFCPRLPHQLRIPLQGLFRD
jgi:hypothetical protein